MIEPNEELILPIAYGFARTYRLDAQDIAQELRLWWVKNAEKAEKWSAEDASKTDQNRLSKSLRNAASRYCRQEKAQKAGYRTQDEFFYDTELVRLLIGYVWHPERITGEQRNGNDNGRRNPRPAHEGNNLPAMVADIAQAVAWLPLEERSLLIARFDEDLTFPQIARDADVEPHTVEMRVHRALEHVVTLLGGKSPWNDGPGSRKAMSNAQAQALTRNQETR